MDDVAIKVEHVSKSFKLPHDKQTSIKGGLISLVKHGKRTYEKQEVLKGVSFEIKKGEFFGIVGRNGSGKSTLLKMLAGIYVPTAGHIQVNGSLTPFIELGVGFNPELTGRENVFLNGALLGFSRPEMEKMYDDIVNFAELERFMDQKLKNYSSGMQVRLAFSIAIRANSDILLLDEVLAVGDEAFQRKCYAYFETLKRNRKTVVLVTHDMSSVERFCNRAMFIDSGEIKLIGDPRQVAAAYSRSNDDNYVMEDSDKKDSQEKNNESKKSCIISEIRNEAGKLTSKFTAGDYMNVKIGWTKPGVQHANVVIIRESGEQVFNTNTYYDGIQKLTGNSVVYRVKLNLAEGTYFLKFGIHGIKALTQIDVEENGPRFVVSRNKDDSRWGGLTRLDHEWQQNK